MVELFKMVLFFLIATLNDKRVMFVVYLWYIYGMCGIWFVVNVCYMYGGYIYIYIWYMVYVYGNPSKT